MAIEPLPPGKAMRTLVQYGSGVPSGSSSMDNKIWRNLPMDVLERVLKLLPLAQMLRCRTVCKDWRCLLSSAAFLEQWTRHSVVPLGVIVFVSEGRQPRVLPPWLSLHKFVFPFLPKGYWALPCAASGGLICFSGSSLCRPFLICDPLTGNWKRLPIPLLRPGHPAAGRLPEGLSVNLVVDYGSKSYTLQVVWDRREVFTYDSGSGSWATSAWIPRLQYCVPGPESNYYKFLPVEIPQGLYVVGIHLAYDSNRVGIWKADPWELISMMPKTDCTELFENCQADVVAKSVTVIEHCICLYLCLNGRRTYPPFSLGIMGLITYHLTRKTWGSWLVDFYENIPTQMERVYPIFSLNPMASQIVL